MLDTAISFIVSEPRTVAIYVAAGFFCLWLGWMTRGLGTNRRETMLKQAALDAKRSIPQLETSVRSREQKIDRLNLELVSQRERIAELDQAAAQQDSQIKSQLREIRTLTTELSSAKKLQESGSLLLQGSEYDTATDDLDAESQRRINIAESLYEELRKTLSEREEKIAELELQLDSTSNPPAGPAQTGDIETTAALDALHDQINAQQTTIARLETQLSELRQDREMLSDLARSRSKNNQTLQENQEALQTRVPELEKALEQLGAIVQDREASIRLLNSELDHASRDKKRQQDELQNCIADMKVQEEAREALESRVIELSEEIQTQQAALRDMQYTLDQSESWLSKFKVSAAKRSEELANITAERDALLSMQQGDLQDSKKTNNA